MADAPVDGQDPGTEERQPASPPVPQAADAEAAHGSAATEADEGATEQVEDAEPKTEPAKGRFGTFDVFAGGKPEPIPVSEAPDIEAEAEEEARAADPGAVTTFLSSVAAARAVEPETLVDEGEGEDDGEDDDEALTELVGHTVEDEPETLVDEDEDGPIEPAPPATEVEETTLIPKVTDTRPAESTTVMPPVSAPTPGMAHRPYTSAPSGYGARSARTSWGSDQPAPQAGPAVTPAGGLPDAQPTQVQPRISGEDAQPTRVQPAVPAGVAAAGNPRSYRPPEFHKVDAGRSELPPPQNFRLDRRELDAAADEEGGRKFGRRALLIGAAAAVAAAAGLTVSGLIKLPGTTPSVPTVGFSPAADSGASSATQTGTAFLTAWQNGEFETAANITDNPTEALAAFKWYKKNLGVVGMVLNPNAANSVGWMTYSVTTQAGSPMGQWEYQSGFAAYSKQIDGYTRWFVQWNPQILYTSLKTGYQLKITRTPASIQGVGDKNGTVIDTTAHPSLAGLVAGLTKSAKVSGGTEGQQIIMVDAKGSQLSTVATLTQPINSGIVKTTLDMSVQSAAEAAVTYKGNSSMVAIEPSTGHILAIANNTTKYYDDNALLTRVAPGSTFKIITSTALLSKNLVTLNTNVPCPTSITIESVVLNNSEGEGSPSYTYAEDFARSCNNAFSSFYSNSGVTENLLSDTANTYYGLNQPWDIGFGETAQYMNIPGGLSGAGLAESLVGQGDVVSCPLAMCSVAATVANGSFKQPIVVPGYKQLTATALPSSVQSSLKTMMAEVISESYGTAAGVGFPNNGHFYAKTGTAEVGSGASLYNNSWFVVFDDQHDIALCALGIDGSYGATTAGPECLHAFQHLGYA